MKNLYWNVLNNQKNNWQIVQDVAWKDYLLVPKLTMAGYSVMMKEISNQTMKKNYSCNFTSWSRWNGCSNAIAGIARYLSNVPKIISSRTRKCCMCFGKY